MACLQLALPCKLPLILVVAFAGSLGFIYEASCSSHCSSTGHSGSTPYPLSLKYYVHALDNSSAYIINSANRANPSFGRSSSFAYPLTKHQDINSSFVGYIRGFEVFDNLDPSYDTLLVLNTVTYNDSIHSGTINLHGQANVNLTSYEISIVGGTGDFRGVRGYVAVTNLRTPGSDHIFEQVLYFLPC